MAGKELALGSFTVKDSTNTKKLRQFFEIYKEDYRERSKGGKKLSKKEEEKAERLAREIIEKEGKHAFIITKQEEGLEVPIGFIIFWTELHGFMHSSDIVLHADRVFISGKYRGLGLGQRVILRNLGRVFMDFPSLAYACFHDPFQSQLGFVLESMKRKGLVCELQKRVEENDFFVELNLDVLSSEAEQIEQNRLFRAQPLRTKKQSSQ